MSTVTRRSALRTGGLAAIMAGLMGTTTAPVAAQPAPIPTLATVINADDLNAECERSWAVYQESRSRAREADDRLNATFTPEQRKLYIQESDARGDSYSEESAWQVAELARHLPGLAPTILMVWEHVRTATYGKPASCCTVAEGFEP